MEVIKYFCDCCSRECLPNEGMGQIGGALMKMNDKLEPKRLVINGHYCSDCISKVLDFIFAMKDEKLKENAKNNNPS